MLDHPVLEHSVLLDADSVRILDRRVFPHQEHWLAARGSDEIAAAIRDGVTDGSGALDAALSGMVLVARQHAQHRPGYLLAALRQAASRLATARPTDNLVRDAMSELIADLHDLVERGGTAAIVARVEDSVAWLDRRHRARTQALGRNIVALLDDGAAVLLHGWMDAPLMAMIRSSDEAGKTFRYLVAETRPGLEGARLTAHTLAEMGQSVTLITDGMIATVLGALSRLGRVDALVTGTDRVCMDGHVVATVGTLGAALAAADAGVPYYPLVGAPDPHAPTAADVVLGELDGDGVLSVLSLRTASPLVSSGYWPAFDVVPPRLVRQVVTDQGPFETGRLSDYTEPAARSRVAPAEPPVPGSVARPASS